MAKNKYNRRRNVVGLQYPDQLIPCFPHGQYNSTQTN